MKLEDPIVFYKNLKVSKQIKQTFAGTFLIGLFVHLFMLANKLPNHDDVYCLFYYGNGYALGRWFLAMLGNLFFRLTGLYSLPVINGGVTIFFISLSACLVVALLKIRNTAHSILIGGLMVSFPVITSLLTYMFTAPYFAFSIFLITLAVYLLLRYRWGIIPAIILTCFSLGIYQAYLGVAILLILINLLSDTLSKKPVRSILLNGIRAFVYFICSLILYLGTTRLILHVREVELSNYQNLSSMGTIQWNKILSSLRTLYSQFFLMSSTETFGITGNLVLKISALCCILFSLLILLIFFVKFFSKRASLFHSLFILVFAVLFPIGMFVMYLLSFNSESTGMHTLMFYPVVFIFILPIFLTEQILKDHPLNVQDLNEHDLNEQIPNKQFLNFASLLLWGVLLLEITTIGANAFYDNEAYLEMNLTYEQTSSYYTVLVSRITQLPDYSTDYSVALIGQNSDLTIPYFWEFSNMNSTAGVLRSSQMLNINYTLFLQYYIGYSPTFITDFTDLTSTDTFKSMPDYPSDGSIQIIGDTIVVKFSDP